MGKENKGKVWEIAGWIVTAIQIIIGIVLSVMLYKADLLPFKFMIVLICAFVLIILLCRFMMRKQGGKLGFAIGALIAALFCILLVIVGVYLGKLTGTLQEITGTTEEITRVGVYVLADDEAESITDVKDDVFGILEVQARTDTDNAIEQIEEETGTDISITEYAGTGELADAILEGSCRVILLNEGFVDLISEVEGYEDFADQVKEIAYYEWKTVIQTEVADTDADEETTSDTSTTDDVFTVYISGIDTSGGTSAKGRSDTNILAVVNRNTGQILLISTPRDYYVELSISNGVKDKLTHAGIYGVQVSMDTLEMLYDTEIDYYFRINFSGFEELVDALGGVTVWSDYEFDVSPSYHYVAGYNTLSGIEALAFARERKSFATGDRQRGENQMEVIKGVIKGLQSTTVLTNFTELMNSLEGTFETNVPYDLLSDIVKDQLSENTSWDVVSYSVNGSDAYSTTYSLNQSLYVMIPDEDTVEYAQKLIKAVQTGITVSVSE